MRANAQENRVLPLVRSFLPVVFLGYTQLSICSAVTKKLNAASGLRCRFSTSPGHAAVSRGDLWRQQGQTHLSSHEPHFVYYRNSLRLHTCTSLCQVRPF